jgi:hypothetical protein
MTDYVIDHSSAYAMVSCCIFSEFFSINHNNRLLSIGANYKRDINRKKLKNRRCSQRNGHGNSPI